MDFVVVGIPFDTAQSYRTGARFGPQAVRDFSVLLRPYNTEQEVDIFKYLSGVDYGDLDTVPGNIQRTYESIVEQLVPVLERDIVPLAIGGDHSVTLGELRAVHEVYGQVALVHFDAHSDTWDEYYGEKYTHGTTFRRAVEEGLLAPEESIQIGMRGPLYEPDDLDQARELGFALYTMTQLLELGSDRMVDLIQERVDGRPVFLSFDIDFFDPAYAPGTGTPEVGGPSIHQGLELLRGLTGLRIVGCDCVEVLPAFDPAEITAAAAANVLFELLSLLALGEKESL
jgi:agmatinase